MKADQPFRQALRGSLISLACILLALGAVMASAAFRRPEDPRCGGMLGAGFPALFICDDWGGGSPTGSWNRIDYVDYLNGGLLPGGFLLDLLFYLLLAGLAWLGASRLLRKGPDRRGLSWAAIVSLAFITGLLCGYLVFLPAYFDSGRPPGTGLPTPFPTSSGQAPAGPVSTVPPTPGP